MKWITYLFVLSCLLHGVASGQAYRVTDIRGAESLDPPVLDIQATTARIIHNTNFRFYSFPVNGPATPIPIANTMNPRSIGNGPLNTVMRGNGNQIFISYIIFEPISGNEGYRVEYVMSGDGGATWSYYDILDKITRGYTGLNMYPDNVLLELSELGDMYTLWRNQQSPDSNRISLARTANGGTTFGPKAYVPLGDTVHPAQGLSLKPLNIMGSDNLLMSYSTDTSLYLIRSRDGGATFETPTKILTVGTGGRISNTKLLGLHDGTMYLSYGYWKPHMGMPPVLDMGTILLRSIDLGMTWITLDTIDSRESPLFNLLLTTTGTLVIVGTTGSNVWLLSSKDGVHWSDSTRVNPTAGTATGIWNFGISACLVNNDTVAIAWIDTSTGHDEIYYRTMSIPTAPTVGVDPQSPQVPSQIALFQNYPNPFNPETRITYHLPTAGWLRLSVHDLLGREVAVLVNERKEAGSYTVPWNAATLANGVYFYTLQAGQFRESRRMILLK
ncbi:MAG: T9SS type A sorting domain-containing protein [Bacteroidota bacterium]